MVVEHHSHTSVKEGGVGTPPTFQPANSHSLFDHAAVNITFCCWSAIWYFWNIFVFSFLNITVFIQECFYLSALCYLVLCPCYFLILCLSLAFPLGLSEQQGLARGVAIMYTFMASLAQHPPSVPRYWRRDCDPVQLCRVMNARTYWWRSWTVQELCV